MSDLTSTKVIKIIPTPRVLTIDEQLEACINTLDDIKITLLKHSGKGRFITRSQIILEIKRKGYEDGVRSGRLTPMSLEGRNAKKRVLRSQYEAYLDSMK